MTFAMKMAVPLLALMFLGWDVASSVAQPPRRGPRPGAGRRPEMSGKPSAGGESKSEIKPYDEVITKEAKSKPGLFLTHQIKDKLFYEIRPAALGKDMLWVTQIERTQAGFSYGGMPVGNRVVRWELRDEKVLLRDVKYTIRANVKDSIKQAVDATSVASIIKAFPVKAWGKDKSPVIDVTSLFMSDIKEFSPQRSLGASGMDSSRTFLEEIKAFPQNIEVKVLATYKLGGSTPTITIGRSSSEPRRDPTQSAVTVLLHHSMLVLPEKPMQPRVFDERVGFFTVGFEDYGDDARHQVEDVRFIARWRLEKKDPNADVSEVVKPIVFYVGRGVPDKWKPYIKKGIEFWQPAFAKAGFKNAIVAKMAPSVHEDPNWDAEDARVSTVRWLASTTENAFGPHISDPRSGEILEADVRVYHNVQKLSRDWYFVQASPNDKRAQKLPFPDELEGELLAYVVAHEIGHSLGFPHNMKASSAYTVENLRSPEFTKKNGTEASIMDYGRFNYVAQPGDGATLIPKIGPYDFFAVAWGYRQYKTADDEKKGLAALVAKQKTNRMLRFGNADPSEDPTRQTEDLGSDTVEATRLGLANIDRVAAYLVSACCKKGKDYSLLENMYEQILKQRSRELMHVTAVVGGFEQVNLFYGDADQVYHPISAERQQQAVAFLNEHAFRVPQKLTDPQITMRLEASGTAERVLESQQSILRALIRNSRFQRMAEQAERVAAAKKGKAYTGEQLLADLRKGIWSELQADKPHVNLYRRNLQRAYVDLLAKQVTSGSRDSDLPALCAAELTTLETLIHAKQAKADGITRSHLRELTAQIKKAFETRVVVQSGTSTSAPAFPRRRRIDNQ